MDSGSSGKLPGRFMRVFLVKSLSVLGVKKKLRNERSQSIQHIALVIAGLVRTRKMIAY